MPVSQPRNTNLLDRSNNQEPTCSASILRDASQPASSNFPDVHVLHPDPFAYYKAFVHTSGGQGSGQRDLTPNDDGYTCHEHPDAAGLQDVGNPHQTRARAVPYNLSARLANRSNGAPLATIVEQGSYSTLNSHRSLLSMRPLPALRVVENASPGRASQDVSRSPDDNAQQEQKVEASDNTEELDHQLRNFGSLYPTCDTAIEGPITPRRLPTDSDTSSTTVKTFFRGVIHNVRATSRTRNRSRSSSIHASVVAHGEGRSTTSGSNSQSHTQALGTSQLNQDRFGTPCSEATSSMVKPTLTSPHTRSGSSLTSDAKLSASADLPLLAPLPCITTLEAESGDIPQSLPPVITTCPRERASVRLVHPEPCDAAHAGCTAAAPAHSDQTKDGTSAGHALYGVSCNTAPSPIEVDRARETSQNASFCSTMSTSYSGTVVGVDIDLQHDFSHPVRRSPSPTPVAPVWFTPQMAELERQATVSESPESEPQQVPEAELPRRSITSSALTSLLPIAAASGIVRPNYNTPKISFFSPSGNLIQTEGSSTPGTPSALDFTESPTTTSPYHGKNNETIPNYRAFPPPTCLPPPRPSLRPMTTPPTSSAPLPTHLRHHHTYRHAEQSQIDSTISSTESFIVPALAVKGCDGLVKSESFTFRIGTRPSHDKTRPQPQYRRHRSARSFAEDLRYELKFYRARFITTVVNSCTTEGKGKVLRKRQASNRRTAATAYISMPRTATAANSAGKKRMHNRKCNDMGLLGPLAGHTLRICFCQPYDGAGNSTHDIPCIKNHTGPMQRTTKKGSLRSRSKELDADAVLPNARVVGGTGRTVSGSKDVNKGQHNSTRATGKYTAIRSDGAASTGAARKTATAGG